MLHFGDKRLLGLRHELGIEFVSLACRFLDFGHLCVPIGSLFSFQVLQVRNLYRLSIACDFNKLTKRRSSAAFNFSAISWADNGFDTAFCVPAFGA